MEPQGEAFQMPAPAPIVAGPDELWDMLRGHEALKGGRVPLTKDEREEIKEQVKKFAGSNNSDT